MHVSKECEITGFANMRSLSILMYISYSVYHMVNVPQCKLMSYSNCQEQIRTREWVVPQHCLPAPTPNKFELLAYDLSV